MAATVGAGRFGAWLRATGARADERQVPPVGARSWWLEEALRADPGAPCPSLAGEVTADVCVVGGGFAGLWTAYELTERGPSLGVVVLEADVCGAGGSGANGGFFSSSWSSIESLCHALGEEGGVRWATVLADQVGELAQWAARHDAAIDFHHEGILYARTGEWQQGPGGEAFRLLERHGLSARMRRVDAADARLVADSPHFVDGVVTPDLATIQPARLARELRRVLLERGVRIFERTPMLRFERGGRAHGRAHGPADVRPEAGLPRTTGARPPGATALRVVVPRGEVAAAQVVLTTGAWAAAQRHFRRAFAVCTDFMVVTEPVPDLLREIGWRTHMGIADLRALSYYARRTEDDRIAIGGGALGVVRDASIAGDDPVARRARSSPHLAGVAARGLGWLFPQLSDVSIAAAWSGPMDMTPPSLPFFESAAGGVAHAGLGFSGHGLTSTKAGGKILASLVLREEDEWSRLPVVGAPLMRVPPESLRWPMVKAVAWAYETGDRACEQHRRRGLVRTTACRAFEAYSALAKRHGATTVEQACPGAALAGAGPRAGT